MSNFLIAPSPGQPPCATRMMDASRFDPPRRTCKAVNSLPTKHRLLLTGYDDALTYGCHLTRITPPPPLLRRVSFLHLDVVGQVWPTSRTKPNERPLIGSQQCVLEVFCSLSGSSVLRLSYCLFSMCPCSRNNTRYLPTRQQSIQSAATITTIVIIVVILSFACVGPLTQHKDGLFLYDGLCRLAGDIADTFFFPTTLDIPPDSLFFVRSSDLAGSEMSLKSNVIFSCFFLFLCFRDVPATARTHTQNTRPKQP